jgi:hypothetical protein
VSLGRPYIRYRLLSRPADPGFRGLFARHVIQLGLLGRYDVAAVGRVRELKLEQRANRQDRAELKRALQARETAFRKMHGVNHWLTVLYATLAASDKQLAELERMK